MYEDEMPVRRGSSLFARQDIHSEEQEKEPVEEIRDDVEMQEEEETTISGENVLYYWYPSNFVEYTFI